jgi:hypothetical protein
MTTEMSEVRNLIAKYAITLMSDGHLYLPSKPGAKVCDEIRARKPEIVAELQRREAEDQAAKAAEKVAREEEVRAIRAGEKAIAVHYHDGEYLSGYEVYGPAAQLLEEIGLAKYVTDWGYHVPDKTVQTLGETFTYPAAVEYMRPAQEATAAKKTEALAKIAAAYAEAKATGKPAVLATWMEDCDGSVPDCSTDAVTKWAMPNGTTKITRIHTF